MKSHSFVLASLIAFIPAASFAGTVVNDKKDPTISFDDKNRDKVVNHANNPVSIQMGPDEPTYTANPGEKVVVRRDGTVITKELKNPSKSVVVVRYGNAGAATSSDNGNGRGTNN